MKKILLALTALALASGVAIAQDKPAGKEKRMRGRDASDSAPHVMMRNRDGHGPHGMMSDELHTQMSADRQKVRQLVRSVRAETDDAKKAELTDQLRATLRESADRVQARQEARLAQAEEHFNSLKQRIEQSKANRDANIEEEVRRLIAGERPRRPAAFDDFPLAKHGARSPEHRPVRDGKGPHGPGPCVTDDAPPADCH